MDKTLTRRPDPMTAMFAMFETALSMGRRPAPQQRGQHTRDTAASLYERAARYEGTQPGFAADLRAAAEAMDLAASRA